MNNFELHLILDYLVSHFVQEYYKLLGVMDISEGEDLLYQHISIVIKLLNGLIDKKNITQPHILRRLDYLFERLSDFLGRELENWWSNDGSSENQIQLESMSRLIASTAQKTYEEPVNFQRMQYAQTKNNSNSATSNTESETLHAPGNYKIPENGREENVKAAKKVTESQSYGAALTEPLIRSTETTKDQENVTQEINQQKTANSVVSIDARKTIVEKPRTDVGRYVKETVTTSYVCKICNVNIFDSVKSHVSESNHHKNMRDKRGIDVVGTENTDSICQKTVNKFDCTLCSITTTSTVNMKEHIRSECHQGNLLKDIFDSNIKITKEELYSSELCSATMYVLTSNEILHYSHSKSVICMKNIGTAPKYCTPILIQFFYQITSATV